LNSVKSDFSKLQDYSLIRLYGVDCNQVENVLQAKGDNQQLFLGIFFMDQIEQGINQMANAISTYASWDCVNTVSIGNELVNSGAATPAQIGSYVSTGRSLLKSHGYNGPVVSVDTHVAIINNPELCEHSDYIAFNAHAYWDGSVVGADAGPWLLLQMQRVWSACGQSKSTLCTESGWPHQGQANGIAVASSEEQHAALSSISSTCGTDTIVFNAFDDMWKNPGPKDVEQFWGFM
jgi:exo-beta-1,3-glucanase (GH17 family)